MSSDAEAPVLILPVHETRRVRWRNGRGWTREILRVPQGEGEDFDFRLSIADIGEDSLFSLFPGCDRAMALLAGEGVELSFADGRRERLEPPHGRVAFSGDDVVTSRLLNGPVQDFNAIWKRDRLDGKLLHRPLVGSMVFLPERGVQWCLHVLAGSVNMRGLDMHGSAGNAVLGREDSAWLRPNASNQRVVIEGGAEILLLRLEDRPL